MRDFTVKKYIQIIESLQDNGYNFYNIKTAILDADLYNSNKKVIIRHDIDTKYDLPIALSMAKYESSKDISASYYFRTIPGVFNENIIKQISELGHEIGYHYEVLSLTRGDFPKAIGLFRSDLERLRKIYPVSTICQHGGTLGYYSSTSIMGLIKTGYALLSGKINMKYYPSIQLWEKYDFKDFGIIGDAYLSFDFEKIKYFSDTGLSWDSHGTRIVDNVYEGKNAEVTAHTTDDLIALISNDRIKRINVLVHPANWNDPILKWLKWRTLQSVRNISKKIIKSSR